MSAGDFLGGAFVGTVVGVLIALIFFVSPVDVQRQKDMSEVCSHQFGTGSTFIKVENGQLFCTEAPTQIVKDQVFVVQSAPRVQ